MARQPLVSDQVVPFSDDESYSSKGQISRSASPEAQDREVWLVKKGPVAKTMADTQPTQDNLLGAAAGGGVHLTTRAR